MASNEQILSDLRVAQETGHTLELMTGYKGVPFVAKVQVIDVTENQAHFKAHHPSLVNVHPGSPVRLLGSDYFEPASGFVEAIDLATDHLVLSNFAYLGSHLGDRQIVRVEPVEHYPVLVQGQVRCTGELADISMSGMGLRFDLAQYDSTLKPGATVLITLNLPGQGELTTEGNILSATRAGDAYRLSVRFAPDHPHKIKVFHYLIDRRGEIEEELSREYEQRLGGAMVDGR